jgi:hypothetical protein
MQGHYATRLRFFGRSLPGFTELEDLWGHRAAALAEAWAWVGLPAVAGRALMGEKPAACTIYIR